METLWQDLRYALRGLRQNPGFTVAAALTLGLGLGINTVAFGAIDALLLRAPPGIGDPAGLYRIDIRPPLRPGQEPLHYGTVGLPYPGFRELSRGAAFAQLAAYSPRGAVLGQGRNAQSVSVLYVSREYFSTLRVPPALGRVFAPGDEHELPPSAVLSYRYWRERFAGDRGVLGRTILVDGHGVQVVGVAAEGFNGLDLEPVAAFLSLSAASVAWGSDMLAARGEQWLTLVGRPRAGLPRSAAAARLTAALTPAVPSWWRGRGAYAVLNAVAWRYGDRADESPIPPWVLGVTAAVLLVACGNVAGLLLARGARRRRELALRGALGAARGRIVRQLFTETLVLVGAGAAFGLWLAASAGPLLVQVGVPRLDRLVRPLELVFTAGALVVTTLVTGLLPALRAPGLDVEAALKAGGGRTSPDRARLRLALTAGQMAVSLALLVCAVLFARSLRNAATIPLGFTPEHLLLVNARVPAGAMTDAQWAAVTQDAVERLRRRPGIVDAARAAMPPVRGIRFESAVLPEGRDSDLVFTAAVDPGYFQTVGQRLLEGRDFDARDRAGAAPVAIVDRSLANRFWPGRSPIGACFRAGTEACISVVGVVAEARTARALDPPRPEFYRPLAQRPPADAGFISLLARTSGDPTGIAPAVRRDLLGLDPRILSVEAVPYRDVLRPETALWRSATIVVSSAALLTLLLASLGLYGLVSYLTEERTRELGIRMALGAPRGDILALILREGVRLVSAGAALGVPLAVGAAVLLRSRFYGVSPTDPMVYIGAALALAGAALAASYLPARRAARADPIEALRAE